MFGLVGWYEYFMCLILYVQIVRVRSVRPLAEAQHEILCCSS